MRKTVRVAAIVGVALFGLMTANVSNAAEVSKKSSASVAAIPGKSQQLIIWSSADRDVAIKTVFLYARAAKQYGWMDTVRLLVWGPSAKLMAEDADLQKRLEKLKKVGIELYACKSCADSFGASEKLTELGITVEYTGEMVAESQKNGWHVLTF